MCQGLCQGYIRALPSGRASVKRGGTTGLFASSPFYWGRGFLLRNAKRLYQHDLFLICHSLAVRRRTPDYRRTGVSGGRPSMVGGHFRGAYNGFQTC